MLTLNGECMCLFALGTETFVCLQIEDVTGRCIDMNLIFEPREDKIHIFKLPLNVILLYSRTQIKNLCNIIVSNMIFDRYTTL